MNVLNNLAEKVEGLTQEQFNNLFGITLITAGGGIILLTAYVLNTLMA